MDAGVMMLKCVGDERDEEDGWRCKQREKDKRRLVLQVFPSFPTPFFSFSHFHPFRLFASM